VSDTGAILAALALAVLIVLEFPIAYAFAAAAMVLAFTTGRELSLTVPTAFWQTGSFALLALPLFIVAGTVMAAAEISDRLVAVVERLVGRMRGSLGAVTVLSTMLFGAISGSGSAAIAAIGSVMIPKMRQAGYDHGYATALVACSSVLALLIPPSIPMIVFALTAGLSVSTCFLSTVGPGVAIGLIYLFMNYRWCRRNKVDPPRRRTAEGNAYGTGLACTVWRGGPALFMPVLMLGGIYSGIFTPTEAAAVALVYAFLVGLFVHRTIGWRNGTQALIDGGVISASVVVILFFLLIFAKLLTIEGIPRDIAVLLTDLSQNYYVGLFLINVVLLILGMFIDDISGSILAAVVLMPVATDLGVDPIHFAAIVGTNLGLGNVTPPCAPLLFVAGSISGQSLRHFLNPALRFMLFGHLPVVLLVTYLPDLALFVPNLLMAHR
jgi:tripartite ATP-independent transporter DctM subunit